MALNAGTSLGHYDVTSLLGEGGMGQVWQATDTQLGRQVALKILPDAFAADPDRLARFTREAQILASLNHPNIAAIHGIEEAEGTRALVLELVEGPTLADRIAKGPIPLDEALPIAKQIAEALEAAHEAGVIHRDLKPANIKVREDGTVKVLDFGLAKALDPNPEGDPSQSPTLTAAATQMGVIMGTAAYMSPEQARGKPVDKRADLWAFGAVLFEMLTGRPLFERGDVSEVLASLVLKEPDITAVADDTPPAMRTVLRRCLVKDPKRRLRDIGEARLLLETDAAQSEISFRTGPRSSDTAAGDRSTDSGWRWRTALVAGVVVGVMVSAGAFWWMTAGDSAGSARVTRYLIHPPEGYSIDAMSGLAISPDGNRLLYSATDARGFQYLFLRDREQLESVRLDGTEGGYQPSFSPDGEWIGFRSGVEHRILSLAGGSATSVASDGSATGLAWGTDGTMVYGRADSRPAGLRVVSEPGAEPGRLTESPVGEGHMWPEFLPDGSALLFTMSSGFSIEEKQVALLTLDTGQIDLTAAATQMGVIMGTAAYMSPEQARGKPVDKRADIWAFGAVLFEMLTGRPLFERGDVSEVLASLVLKEPDLTAVADDTPPAMRTVLRRCLVKDAKRRLRDIGEARLLLETDAAQSEISFRTGPRSSDTAAGDRSTDSGWRWRTALVAGVVVGVMVSAGAFWWMTAGDSAGSARVTRYLIHPPEGYSIDAMSGLAISPDGNRLLYSATDARGFQYLFLRDREQLESVRLDGTEGGYQPSFSPDGEWIGFRSGVEHRILSLAGGSATSVASDGSATGLAWGTDGTMVYGRADSRPAGLRVVSEPGAEPGRLTESPVGEGHMWPEFLPDGSALLFTMSSGFSIEEKQVALLTLDTGQIDRIVPGTHPKVSPTGHLLFGRTDSIWAAPFSLEERALSGAAVPVVDGVQVNQPGGFAHYSLGLDGTLAYMPMTDIAGPNRLVWVDRHGRIEPLRGVEADLYFDVALSPDGSRLAMGRGAYIFGDLWTHDVSRQTSTRLVVGARTPVWSRDGQDLIYYSMVSGREGLYQQRWDGSGAAELLYLGDGRPLYPAASHGHCNNSASFSDGFIQPSVCRGRSLSMWATRLR